MALVAIMNIKIPYIWPAVVMACLGSVVCFCARQAQSPLVAHAVLFNPHDRIGAVQSFRINSSWTNAAWTADDKPYAELRAKIDQQAFDGPHAAALTYAYEKALLKHPNDVDAQFAYFYAAYLALKLPGGMAEQEASQRTSDMFVEVITHPHPHTYNYARLVYLCESQDMPFPALVPLGKRLMLRDPNDLPVELAQVDNLAYSPRPNERIESLALAERLVKGHPDKASALYSLASAHLAAWIHNRSKQNADETYDAVQNYLRVAPQNDYGRVEARVMLQFLRASQRN